MITGHYGIAFLASRLEPRLPVWQTMVAVVWLDILHSTLVLAGIERAAIVHGATAVVPVDLIYYPFSHSLVASLLWSAAAFLLCLVGLRRSIRAALFLAGAVFSHFLLDLIAHRPDLPLLGEAIKVGFGLWNHIAATFIVETALLFLPLFWYLRAYKPGRFRERYGIFILALLGSALFYSFPYGRFPDDIRVMEAFALIVYLVVPAIGLACTPQILKAASTKG